MKKYSKQREAILDVLCSMTSHPTAEELYLAVKKQVPEIGLATVYRNLREFRDEGRLLVIKAGDEKEHFDGNVAPHAHLYCSECGRVRDIFLEDKQIEALRGIYDGEFYLTYYGVCNLCNEKNKI